MVVRQSFSKSECNNLDFALKQEWLDTNGLGGFASNTIVGCSTRKYHTLLSALLLENGGRFNLLSKVEDSIKIGKDEYALTTNRYPNSFFPNGTENIESVSIGLFTTTVFNIDGMRIERSVLMPYHKNTVLIRYDLLDEDKGKSVTLNLKPLISYKEINTLSKENTFIQVKTYNTKNGFKIEPYYGMPPLNFNSNVKIKFYPGPDWYKNFEYIEERNRGYEFHEDLFCPGLFEHRLTKKTPLIFSASLEEYSTGEVEKIWDDEVKRRHTEYTKYEKLPEAEQILKYHGSSFILRNAKKELSILAGFPWFVEWGRDAMIALPGLTLYSDRVEQGLEILKTYASYEKNGLLPNYLTKDNAAYNSVDAALWFFWAVQQYNIKTGNTDVVVKEFMPVMLKIIDAYFDANVPYVELKPNGMLWAGNAGTQLTWMDANAWGKPVTSRHGFAVEINALWYNALCFVVDLAEKSNIKIDMRLLETKDVCGTSFREEFWNSDNFSLFDVINERGKDRSIRPNQVFAVSLPYSALSETQKEGVLKIVEKHLLTPFGLRTLSPSDANYCPFYRGSQDQRDLQYHQGTVWAWPMGHFVEGFVKTAKDTEAAKSFIRETLKPLFQDHLREFGIFSVSEIFDGEYPHVPNGCFAQAWSVAEAIRILEFLK